MTERQQQFSGSGPVRQGAAIDEAALARWLQAHVPGFAGPLSIEQFKGGQSNPTYKLITPGRTYVLRRKPPGVLLASAHAIDREYRVIAALHGTGFPVPQPLGIENDPAILGTAFYVMEHVAGRIFWDASLPQLSPADRAGYFDAMNATIAHLHRLDPVAIGLGDYGRPGNYFTRQIGRWSRQYLEDDAAGRVAAMDRLVEWLPQQAPPGDETAIVHGDFRCDNMIFDAEAPRVLAVLDWELSTLGHPLADFAYHLMMYRMPAVGVTGLGGVDLAAFGIPTERAYAEAYCRRSGRDPATLLPHLDFLIAFNMFRLAAIVHGIRGRLARGTAASAHAQAMAATVEPLAGRAWEIARGA